MSQENVEIVRKAGENFNRGDFDAFIELFDDDVVLRMAEGWPERVFFGKAAVRSFIDGWVETVGQEVVVEDLIDAGNAVVMRPKQPETTGPNRLDSCLRADRRAWIPVLSSL
jgi:hypothetical protein